MNFIRVATAVIVMTTAIGSNANSNERNAQMNISNKEKVVSVLNSIETGDATALAYINPTKYIQHNLSVADGVSGFGEVLQQLPKGSAKVAVARSFQDGNYVFTHTDYNFFGPKIGFDIFRFEAGVIVEHWDNLQEKVETSVSGRSQIDGTTEITDIHKTSDNKSLVKKLIDDVFLGANPNNITQYISTTTYLQHNPAVGDGLNALGQALKEMALAGTPMTYKKNHLILGEGNFVLAVSEGEFLGNHVSFYDLFRIENGKVVEHWDTIEQIPASTERKNDNGKFNFPTLSN